MSDHDTNLARLTTGIVAAYVEHNDLGAQHLPDLIRSVHQVLGSVGAAPEPPTALSDQTHRAVTRSR
jgi:predicted transcriptional regulator